MKIKEIKDKYGASTSESLFGLEPQPPISCTIVDSARNEFEDMVRRIESSCREIKWADNIEEAQRSSEDIDWAASSSDIIKQLEDLRKQCSDIRAWGESWKRLAIELIEKEENVEHIEQHIADKHFNLY